MKRVASCGFKTELFRRRGHRKEAVSLGSGKSCCFAVAHANAGLLAGLLLDPASDGRRDQHPRCGVCWNAKK